MLELNKIYNENNLDTLSRIPNDFIDLTVTSPPYDNLRNYNGFSWDFENLAKELFRVTKVGGIVVWVVADATIKGSETLTSFKQAIFFKEVCGFNVHDTMLYKSEKPTLNHNRYEQKFEYMFVFSKGKPKTFNPIMVDTKHAGLVRRYNYGVENKAKKEKNDAMRYRNTMRAVKDVKIKGNIWEYNTGYLQSTKDIIAFEHPAIFPE